MKFTKTLTLAAALLCAAAAEAQTNLPPAPAIPTNVPPAIAGRIATGQVTLAGITGATYARIVF
jgi:hypothetical protein